MDEETKFYLANYGLMTSAPITKDFVDDTINYYVVEPVSYTKDDGERHPAHRLYLMDCTYDALMREIFEELIGFRMSGDKYHLTISVEEMEFLMEKRILWEIRGAERLSSSTNCSEEEAAWYEAIRQVWLKFIDFVQKVYLDYGAVRPEIAVYGPYNLQKEGIPPTYREFLLDCLK